MIDEKKLYKEIEHLEFKMREAYRNYQDTGINRYYTQYTKYEDTMNVYERALSAKEDHDAAIAYKAIISEWASKSQNIKYMPYDKQIETALAVCNEIVTRAILEGIIRKE